MRSELILVKKPDLFVGKNFLQKALETHPTYLSYAVANNGVIESAVFPGDEYNLETAVETIQKEHSKQQVYFHLMKLDGDDLEGMYQEALQPFSILTQKNKQGEEQSILSLMLDGEFAHYAKMKDGIPDATPAYNIVTDYLAEKIRDIYKRNNNNLEKTVQEMDTPQMRKDMKIHTSPRGVILVIPSKYKSFSYSDNKLDGEYPWGFATRTLGIEPPSLLPTTRPEGATAVSGTSRPLTLKERMALKTPKKPEPVVPEAPVIEEKKEPDKSPVIAESEHFIQRDGVWYVKPGRVASHKEAKQFWGRNSIIPRPDNKNHQDVYKGFPATKLRANSPLVPWAQKLGIVIENVVNPGEKTAFRDAMATATEKKTAEAAVDKAVSGILTLEQKKKAVELRKKPELWLTPEQMVKEVALIPTYTKQVQIPLDAILYASRRFFFELGIPVEGVQIIDELRCVLLAERNSRTTTTQTTVTTTVGNPPAETVVVKQEEPPVKRNILKSKKAA